MNNMEKYQNAFAEAFEVEPEASVNFVYRETEQWDSIGHMSLIAALEDAFSVEMEPEEILAVISYEAGLEVLRKKGIEI